MKSAAITLRNTWKSYNLSSYFPISRGGVSDKLLLFLAISLAAFGLVMVYSASYIFSQEKVGDGLYYFNKHIVFLALGFISLTFCRFLDYRIWEKYAPYFFFSTLGLMLLTQVPGISHRAGGASRWINIGGFSLQPVEFAKLSLIMMLASGLSKPNLDFDKITSGLLFLVWPLCALVPLCMLQSDFGSTALLVTTTAMLLYLAGVHAQYLIGAACAALPFLVAAMAFSPYRRARVMTFLDPWADPQGAGFQIVQSFIAFYRGGVFGAGLGNGKAKVFYLPEAHNDFILSVVGEELGFVGFSILCATFLLLIFRGIKIAASCNSRFAALLSSGLILLLGLEVFWNGAIVLGLFPTKGMNLPFISSGGSSIICALSIIGILLNISAQNKREPSRN